MRPILVAAFAAVALAADCAVSLLPEGGRTPLAYVAVSGDNCVAVLDLASGSSLGRLYTGAAPWRLAVAPDRRRLPVQHWYAGTTAVVDLGAHEIEEVLPHRGPGGFAPGGDRYLTFDWPASTLTLLDGHRFTPLGEQRTGASRVYDLAVDPRGETLYAVQYDPMARGESRQRYGYVATLPLGAEGEAGAAGSIPTGADPVRITTPAHEPFLLTADSGTDGLTVANSLGATRALAVCAGPRAVLLSPDERRLAVACWRGEPARASEVVTVRSDFTARPWPQLVEEARVTLDGALVAGAFSPDGRRLYLADRAGGTLVELEAARLRPLRRLPVGDVPLDVAVVEVPAAARRRLLAGAGAPRRKVEEWLSRMPRPPEPPPQLAWTEVDEASEGGDAGQPPTDAATAVQRRRVFFQPPDRLRVEYPDGRLLLAAGGHSVTVDPGGRFWVAPRQELLSIVLGLAAVPVDDAVRRLAGDVPGSPFLRGGLAVDRVAEVDEAGERSLVIGAVGTVEPAAQLWVDTTSGRPTDLVEQVPVFAVGAHGAPGLDGFVETKLYDFQRSAPGVWLPSRLERRRSSGPSRWTRIEAAESGPPLPGERFDLALLGGFSGPPAAEFIAPVTYRPVAGEPGLAVPVLPDGYLARPWEPHPPYNSNPPTSGARLADLAAGGVHELPVPPELLLHNLEHGAVALQYRCPRGCPELVAALTAVAARHPEVVVAPYPLLEARLAATAWGRIDLLDDFDGARIERFIAAYTGRDHHAPVARTKAPDP